VQGLDVDGAAISLLTAAVSRETLSATDPTAATLEDQQVTLGEGACIEAAVSGRPIPVPDIHDHILTPRWPMFASAVAERTGVAGAATLVDPQTGLVLDGLNPDGPIRRLKPRATPTARASTWARASSWPICDGHPRWTDRAATVLDAITTTMVGSDGVTPGFDDGGDSGLFNGILARYWPTPRSGAPSSQPSPHRSC
jgi:hypothetical protein